MKTKDVFRNLGGICLLLRITLFVCVALIMLLSASVTYAQGDSISQELTQLLANLQTTTRREAGQGQAPEEPPRVSFAADGYLRFVGAPPACYFPVTSVVPGKPEETAYNFLKEHANLFGAPSAAIDFRILKSKSKSDRNYVRFEQTYAGVPVFAAQVIVQLNALAGVECVISDIARDTQVLDNGIVSVVPLISGAEAHTSARDLFTVENPDIEIGATTPQLKMFVPYVLGSAGSIRLVWDIKVYSEGSAFINEHILLDAHSGEIVRHYPLNKHERNREVFDSNNTTADPGTLTRAEGDPPSGIADVDDAYDFLGDAYDFYDNQHGRDSIDGDGMHIEATVRYCSPNPVICGTPLQCPCPNAFWSGGSNRLYFGDGFAVDDIVGHEYTHGVTGHESDLVYENHSGAIDESFSDVWGEFIDLGNGAGNDAAAVRWECGEDTPWGTFRDMADPPTYPSFLDGAWVPQPDRMGDPNFYTGNDDNGGVHHNCGVNNKLCFLLTDGDAFNGQTVTGMGIGRVADLYYEVQTDLLTSGADYTDLYHALTQAAVNLGWTTQQRNNLYRACLAVEIAVRRDIYVDGASIWPWEDGSEIFPFKTINRGNNAAFPGDRLIIKSGSYDETITFDKIMKVIAREGAVTIGQ